MIVNKLGVLGDIHCETEALSAAISLFRREGADAIAAVGDMVDGAGDVNQTCALLEQKGVLSIQGNHERWLLAGTMRDLPNATPLSSVSDRTRRYLSALPKTISLMTAAGPLLLCHGVDTDDMAVLSPDTGDYDIQFNTALQSLLRERKYSMVIGGHTHKRMVRTIDSICFINAGTLHPRYNPCVLIADFKAGSARFFNWINSSKLGSNAFVLAETFPLPRPRPDGENTIPVHFNQSTPFSRPRRP